MAKSRQRTRVLVTVSGRPLDEVVPLLTARGLRVANVMTTLGVVSGEIADGRLAALRAIPGVAVEVDQAVQLPPPDADVQ